MRPTTVIALLLGVLLVAGCSDSSLTLRQDPPSSSASTTTRAATTAAHALIALARHRGTTPRSPWTSTVGYSIGGAYVGEVRPGADLARALAACPLGATEYESRACPVSPLDTLRALTDGRGRPVIERGEATTVGCNRFRRPAGSAGLDAVTIRPPADVRDCFADFAVTLYLDHAGTVRLLDLTLSAA